MIHKDDDVGNSSILGEIGIQKHILAAIQPGAPTDVNWGQGSKGAYAGWSLARASRPALPKPAFCEVLIEEYVLTVLFPYGSVRKSLDLGHTLVGTVYVPGPKTGMQRNMRGHHIESIREVESVDRFLQVPVYVVSIDRAAAGRRT